MKNITIGRRSFFLGAVAAAVSSALPAPPHMPLAALRDLTCLSRRRVTSVK